MALMCMLSTAVVQANQCSSGIECPSDGEPKSFVSLLQTMLRMNVLEDGPSMMKNPFAMLTEPEGDNQQLIPRQLVMTGQFSSIDELPLETKKNLDNTRKYAPGFTMRYLNDGACQQYLQDHFDSDLAYLFSQEKHGSFRGDICRSAVLLREGGFYTDLDFQLNVSIESLIDENTTLMTALVAQGPWLTVQATAKLSTGRSVSIQPILNALIAVQPKSSIMERTIKNIKAWYKNKASQERGLLGPMAMAESLAEMVQEDCPSPPFAPLPEVHAEDGTIVEAADPMARWACGSEKVRLYQEEYLGDTECGKGSMDRRGAWRAPSQVVCPPGRRDFFGLQFGVFSMGEASRESRLIGWSRYLGCAKFGCGINGGEATFLQTPASMLEDAASMEVE